MKLIALLLILSSLLSASKLLVVIADDFNASTAKMTLYKEGKKLQTMRVNLGRNGLGWGLGEYTFSHSPSEPRKVEGDGKAPAGIFRLEKRYHSKSEIPKDLLCVDDSTSSHYNTILPIKAVGMLKSFEYMHRDDTLYDQLIVVAHNAKRLKKRGSCIFIHNEKAPFSSTAGCTSMNTKALKKVLKWLKEDNAYLIQLPRAYCAEAKHYFPFIECP